MVTEFKESQDGGVWGNGKGANVVQGGGETGRSGGQSESAGGLGGFGDIRGTSSVGGGGGEEKQDGKALTLESVANLTP